MTSSARLARGLAAGAFGADVAPELSFGADEENVGGTGADCGAGLALAAALLACSFARSASLELSLLFAEAGTTEPSAAVVLPSTCDRGIVRRFGSLGVAQKASSSGAMDSCILSSWG